MINILPKGIIKDFLNLQKDGLTGHIENAGYPFNTVCWGKSDDGYKWYDFEQVAYWLDGYTKLGILLKDEAMIEKASGIIYDVINNPDSDGYLGPKVLKESDGWCRWPHVVFFRAALALYQYNNDPKIIEAISNHYLNGTFKYDIYRDVINVEIMLMVYSYNNNEELLKLAIESYDSYNKSCENDLCDKVILSNKKVYVHGVSFNEYLKLSAILYKYTNNKKYLKVCLKAQEKIDQYYMLIDGLHCSDEYMINNDIYQSHETCCVSDYTWSLNYMYLATGDTKYLDKIEKCIFNAGMGSITKDFRALQYFSCPNQVIADSTSNHNDFFKGSKWMSYRPNPGTECCPGNVNRFMPNYVWNMYEYKDKILYVKLFGASEFYKDGKLILKQETSYPYENTIKFTNMQNDVLTINIRCSLYYESMIVDGCEVKKNSGFYSYQLKPNQQIEVTLVDEIKKHIEDGYIYFSKGVLLYAFPVEANVEIDLNEPKSNEEFKAYNLTPKGTWSYGLTKECKAEFINGEIIVEAYEITNWNLSHRKNIRRVTSLEKRISREISGDFYFTPKIIKTEKISCKENKESIKLVPYGKTLLRLTAFPIINK